jgi:hypothetical protein
MFLLPNLLKSQDGGGNKGVKNALIESSQKETVILSLLRGVERAGGTPDAPAHFTTLNYTDQRLSARGDAAAFALTRDTSRAPWPCSVSRFS